MAVYIFLTEGPNVHGLSKDRTPLYVGYFNQKDGAEWIVIEGKKVGTPRSYKVHIGSRSPLEESEITDLFYNPRETAVRFRLREINSRLIISNTSDTGRLIRNGTNKLVETVYNFFGNREASSMMPQGWEEYYKP